MFSLVVEPSNIGILEKKMETRYILGLYWGYVK